MFSVSISDRNDSRCTPRFVQEKSAEVVHGRREGFELREPLDQLKQMTSNYDFETQSSKTRLEDEVSLLQAMYPEQVMWDSRRREIKFVATHEHIAADILRRPALAQASLVLRLPDDYLSDIDSAGVIPTIISAADAAKQDLRATVIGRWQSLNLNEGEEILDQVLLDFQDLIDSLDANMTQVGHSMTGSVEDGQDPQRDTLPVQQKAVIIWLHHLLALGKRKLALNPALTSTLSTIAGNGNTEQIRGMTKPGYPGIMIFVGPADLIDAHVSDLKSQRWQAFQVRFEEFYDQEERWTFEHGTGIKEVESIAEVAAGIQGEDRRETFLKAAGVK